MALREAGGGGARPSDPARAHPAWSYDALVLDAGSRQGLAVIRSLGSAGLRVAAGECFAECDPRLPALGFRSRHAHFNVVLPSFATDPEGFAEAVVRFVQDHPTRVILPGSDGSITALRPKRAQLSSLGTTLALPTDHAMAVANDKDRTLTLAQSLGIDCPETVPIDRPDDVPAALARLGLPVVLKPSTSWPAHSSCRLRPTEVIDRIEAEATTRQFLHAGCRVLAQEWVGGRREGVSLFIVEGDVRAAFGHVEHRTTPALGGASVVRESTTVPPDLYDTSVRLAKAIGLEGLCEVEFRRDRHGRPLLMEVNARLTGVIETAWRAGVDFPAMVWRWASGLPVEGVTDYRTGLRMRWLRGDMRWLKDSAGQSGRPDSMSWPAALWAFTREFVHTYHYDCMDPHDLRPVAVELRTTVRAVRGYRKGRNGVPLTVGAAPPNDPESITLDSTGALRER